MQSLKPKAYDTHVALICTDPGVCLGSAFTKHITAHSAVDVWYKMLLTILRIYH